MVHIPTPTRSARAHEQSQGPAASPDTSPDDLKAFHEDMERSEALERKLSERKSGSGFSLWSRRSFKRSTIGASILPTSPDVPRMPSKDTISDKPSQSDWAQGSDQGDRKSVGRQLAPSRSVIGDSREAPAWMETGAWAAVPLPALKVNYPLHNPLGPRWYRNHHLIPPSQKRPSMRPPTFFSPSFPPMHSSSSPDHALDDSEGPSRTPADSPLPTPTSSQTRVADGGKARSRKTSQTTPDNVDLLDLTDPWGQNWHHQSPYDFGQPAASSADTYEVPNRTRRASMTAVQNRHNPITPSPLSQSTSAVHLHPPQPEIHIPRKLSKRRTPTVDAIFNRKPSDAGRADKKVTSAPPTPIERVQMPATDFNGTSLPKRMHVAPPLSNSAFFSQQTPKKEKRSSMLDRLARKFSKLRKSVDERGGGIDYWENINTQEVKGYPSDPGPPHNFGRSSPEKPRPESVKRVAPPSIEQPPEPPAPANDPPADRVSLTSLEEAKFSIGKLTVANPDYDTVENDLPPPPPEKVNHPPESSKHEASPLGSSSNRQSIQTHRMSVDEHLRVDKPLPPPQIPTPHFSVLGLPELDTPKIAEQPLPPPPASQEPTPQPNQPKPLPAQLPPSTRADDIPQRTPTPPQPQHLQRKLSGSTDLTGLYSNKAEASVLSAPQTTAGQTAASYVADAGHETLVYAQTTGPDRSQSLLQSSFAQYELPQKPSPQPQRTSSPQKTTHPPEPAPAPAPASKERASTAQPQAPSPPPQSSRATQERAPEPSSSRHTPKQSRHQSRVEPVSYLHPPSKSQAIPFPSHGDNIQYEASPLSTSSVLANPPTPYDMRDLILSPDQSAPPSLPPKSIYEGKEGKKATRIPSPVRTSGIPNPSSTSLSPTRQTETFRLVRSSSGNVYASSQTITAAGQQWEVVESDPKGHSKEKQPWPKESDQQHHARDREQERRSKEYDSHRTRDRDHERKSRGYETRDDDVRRAEREQRSKDHEQRRSERKSREGREGEKSRAQERSRDYDQPRDHERHREHERVREHEKPRDREKVKDHDRPKDYERVKEHDRSKDAGKSREYDKPRDRERSREYEKSREYDRPKEKERVMDYDKPKEKEHERSKGHERSREHERSKDYDRRRESDKPRDHGKSRDHGTHREPEKARESSKQKERERTKDHDYEWSKDRELLKEYERSQGYQRSKDRDRDLPKAPEASSRREAVEPRAQVEVVEQPDNHRSSHKAAKPPAQQEEPPKSRSSHTKSSNTHQRDDNPRDGQKRSSRKRDEAHDRKADHQRPAEATSSSSHRHNPPAPHQSYPAIPIVVQPSDEPPAAPGRLERNPSLTARPTSEMPSAAEMNAMRAKELWEMERLWKARSMYGLEPNAPTTNFIQSPGSSSSRSEDEANTQSAVHGSAHTAYVMPTPFQGRQIYHSMPTAPPPIIYSSPASIPSIPDFLSSYDPHEQQQQQQQHNYQGYLPGGVDHRSPPNAPFHEPRASLNNPLPEPPRESPLITLKKGGKPSAKHTSDYTTRYNGIAIAR